MRKKRGFIDIQNMKPRFTFIFKRRETISITPLRPFFATSNPRIA